MKALREKVDIPKCSREAAGPPGHRASVNHLAFIPRISMCVYITPHHTTLSVYTSCQDCIPLVWGLTEVGSVLLILCPHCCYMGNVFQVWRCTVARCQPSVITLLPKAEATAGRGKREGNRASQTMERVKVGRPALQPGQPLSPVDGVGAHVKDLPIFFTWSQFAFSHAPYVS